MASKSLGTLTLDIVAKTGGFTAGMSEAERAAKKSADKIQASIKGIGIASYAIGNAIGGFLKDGITAAANAFPQLIEQAAQFQDLAEKTGGSAEGLASLAVAAKVGGTSMEEVAAASVKLTKGLTGVDDESKAAGAALAALGIPLEDFKRLAPEEQMAKVAEALGGFADGAGKTAVAVDLFGKAGANLLPFLKELYQQGGLQKILTAEQIKQADDYSDRITRQRAEFSLAASAVATQFLPAITALTGVMTDLIKETIGVSNETTKLGQNQGVANFVESAVKNLGTLLDAAQLVGRAFDILGTSIGVTAATAGALLKREFSQAATIQIQGASDVYNKIANIGDNLISSRVGKAMAAQKQLAADAAKYGFGNRPGAPELVYSGKVKPDKAGGKGATDDPTKKLLDNDLKAYQAQADAAKELLADRNKILDLYNSQGLISVKDYYAALQGNLDEATATQMKSYSDQIKALQDYQAKAGKDTEKADAQGKINDLLTKQAKLQRESGNAAIEMGVKQQQATQAYRDSLNEVNAKILELDGNLGKAAEIRFDAQNRQLRELAKNSGDFASVAQIDRLREYTKAQADLNAVQAKFSLAQGDLQIAEERITQARERGTMGEIQGLQASGKARQEAVAIMQQQLDKFQAIDVASRTPEQGQAIERLKLQLEGLKATIDPLADKINTMFSDAAGNAFGDFITGAKSAKEAFNDFSKSIFNDLARMAAKDLMKSLFGGGGDATGGFGINIGAAFSKLIGGGSLGDSFSSLFGGGSKGTDRGASAMNPLYVRSVDSLGGSALTGSNGSSGLLGNLFSGAASLFGGFSNSTATSMANVSGGGLDDLLKFTKNFQGFAGGGFTGMGAANDPAGIVHKGEYVLDAAATRRLGVANLDRVSGGGGMGMNQTVNFSVQGQIDRRTETQLANKLRRETNTAGARFK